MGRRVGRRNIEWETPQNNFSWDHVAIEVLMDIRQELKDLNTTLRCHRVWQGMDAIQRIDRRLAKKILLRSSE